VNNIFAYFADPEFNSGLCVPCG